MRMQQSPKRAKKKQDYCVYFVCLVVEAFVYCTVEFAFVTSFSKIQEGRAKTANTADGGWRDHAPSAQKRFIGGQQRRRRVCRHKTGLPPHILTNVRVDLVLHGSVGFRSETMTNECEERPATFTCNSFHTIPTNKVDPK